MKKYIILSGLLYLAFFAQGQIREARTVVVGGLPSPPSDKGLRIFVYNAKTYSFLKDPFLRLRVGDKTLQTTPLSNDLGTYFYYKETIPDSMLIEAGATGFQPVKYMFYKHIHHRSTDMLEIHLTREGEVSPNMIVVVGNRVEVTLEGQTTVHDLAALRQSPKEEVLQVLTRLPGLELAKSDLKMNGKLLERLYINGHLFSRMWDNYQYDVIKQMKKFKKKAG